MTTRNERKVIGPEPVPMNFTVSTIPMPEGDQLIGLNIQSPTGQFVAFLEPDGADSLADHLTQAAQRARTGLIVANAMSDIKDDPRLNRQALDIHVPALGGEAEEKKS